MPLFNTASRKTRQPSSECAVFSAQGTTIAKQAVSEYALSLLLKRTKSTGLAFRMLLTKSTQAY